MKNNKKICMFFLLFSLNLYGEFASEGFFIDTPTGYFPETPVSIGLSASITTIEDPYPRNLIAYISIKPIKRFLIGTSFFRGGNISFDTKVKLVEEDERIPGISVGVMYISPRKYILPVGSGRKNVWGDDATYPMRCSERFSWYISATKEFGAYGTYNIGIGRGVFVGYGSRSYLFNSDIFFDDYHNDAIGMIWGMEIPIRYRVHGAIDFDGRDFNVGIKIKTEAFQIGIGAVKIEHRLWGLPALYPRFCMGIIINSLIIKEWIRPSVGILSVHVADGVTGAPKMALVSFPGRTIPSFYTEGETGTGEVYLEPGVYWVRASTLGGKFSDRKVFIAPGRVTRVYFKIWPLRGP